jgi:hypothetical protein
MSCKFRTAGDDLLRLQIPIHGDSGVDTADKYLKAFKEAVFGKERPKASSTEHMRELMNLPLRAIHGQAKNIRPT